MRIPALRILSSLILLSVPVLADTGSGTGLYPPNLQPLITTANALLSAGQFNDAARAYSEAIGKYYCLPVDRIFTFL
jgi:DnaJ homolog subfamily C member 3